MSNTTSTLPTEIAIQALNQAPQGLVISGNDDTILWANQTLADWLGTPVSDLAGKNYASVMKQYFRTPSEEEPDLLTTRGDDETPPRWLQRNTIPVETGSMVGTAVFFTDISTQHKLSERLDQLETIEPVSRLLNRRAMMQNLDPLISRSRRYDNPLSVITMELLNLEQINTDHGEQAANHAVLELSHLLKDQLRWADIISRTDDNHIVIILPETSKEDAGRLAEKINAQVADLQIHYESAPQLHLEACYGVAAWEKGNDSLLLLRNASQALVRARDQGQGKIDIA